MLFTYSSIPKGLSVRWLASLEPLIVRRFKPAGSISIAFISESEMRRLNMLYRGKDTATDVLSFRLHGTPNMGSQDEALFAEIVFNLRWLRMHARERGTSVQEEFQAMVIHGVVHTLGYDHEKPQDARDMQRVEQAITRALQKNLGNRAKIQYTKDVVVKRKKQVKQKKQVKV